MPVLGHLLRTIFRAFFRIITVGLLCALAALSIVFLADASNGIRQWPPSHLTDAAVLAITLLAGYAGAVTVVLVESARAVAKAVCTAEREASHVESLAGEAVKAAEQAAHH